MRLIDADAIGNSILEKWGVDPKYLDDSLDAVKDAQTLEWINSVPSIDIVRCKECKYEPICSHSVQHTTHEPASVTIGYKSVGFCSYGEREGK